MLTITEALLDAANRTGDGAPSSAREMATYCLLDWLGVTLAGSGDPLVDVLVEDALSDGGEGDWPLLGRDERVGLRDFVLVNGVAGHVLDYDDGLAPMMGHPSVAIMPALLAVATARGCSGAELLDAIVTSVEMAARVGLLLTTAHYERGFHSTGTVGAIAAAAGCARLMRLDRGRALIAIGLAGTRAAGLKASFGTGGKPLHAGWAALNGYTAANWAERGFSGPSDILGDKSGWVAVVGEREDQAALAEPPAGAHIMAVSFKQFASCGLTHPAIRTALALRSVHRLPPAAIEHVRVVVSPKVDTICNIAAPATGLQAKFSLRATLAMAFSGVDIASPASFSDERVCSPEHIGLQDRIEVLFDEQMPLTGCRLQVRTRGGEVLDAAPPARVSGLTDELRQGLVEKFRALVSTVLGEDRARVLADEVLDIAQSSHLLLLLERVADSR